VSSLVSQSVRSFHVFLILDYLVSLAREILDYVGYRIGAYRGMLLERNYSSLYGATYSSNSLVSSMD
jgi:hypothetical protein